MLTIGIIGDYSPTYTLHIANDAALAHAGAALSEEVTVRWLPTADLAKDVRPLTGVDAAICAPGSPYESLDGALAGLRFCRENQIPTLGTCGGCQHMIVEYAQNVVGIEAKHAEYDPSADDPVVSPLACSLVGRTGSVDLETQSVIASIYGATSIQEQYYCTFGVNPAYEAKLSDAGLRVAGRDADDQVARIFHLPTHPFYVATLFVPQARSTATTPHPLVVALVEAGRHRSSQR